MSKAEMARAALQVFDEVVAASGCASARASA